MTALRELESWFLSQCDGDWEHGEGIRIATLDNPGWAIDIDLVGTDVDNKKVEARRLDRGAHDWLHMFITDGKFKIRCGPTNLEQALDMFLRWADDTRDVEH